MGKSKKKSLLLRDAQSDGPCLTPRPSPTDNRNSRSHLGGSPISTLVFPKKALGGFSPHPHVSQVPVTNEVSFTETLDYVNNVVPGSSSVVGVERQALDGCPGSLAGHNMNVSQQALVVAGPQPSSSSFRLPLAGGVNGHSSGVVPPDGSGQGPPPSSSPPQVLLYLLLMKIALGSLHCPPLPLALTLLMFVNFIILMYVLCYLKILVNLETSGNCV